MNKHSSSSLSLSLARARARAIANDEMSNESRRKREASFSAPLSPLVQLALLIENREASPNLCRIATAKRWKRILRDAPKDSPRSLSLSLSLSSLRSLLLARASESIGA